VLVVEDDERLRNWTATLLQEAGYDVVEAGTGSAALAEARVERPQAVVLDVLLPDLSGYEVCHTLRTDDPHLPIVFVSGERVESYDRVAGLLIGADDYLVKPFAGDELLARLRRLLQRVAAPARSGHGLTVRELEVLRQLAAGFAAGAIAERLGISPKTVGTHIEHIFSKLGVRTRAQAVAAAYRARLVPDVEAYGLGVDAG
jgi:DNA-binding response OmpR family regulator